MKKKLNDGYGDKMQTCDPLKARQQFKILIFTNWAIAIGTFILLHWILRTYINVILADTLAIALVFCLFFFFLKKRIIAIKCEGCGKIIETNTPWVCGACGAKIRRVYDYPFVSRCVSKSCNYEPKAYRCHHVGCGALIFLSNDKSEINIAQCLNMPDKPKPVVIIKNEHAEAVAKEQKSLKIAGLKVQRAELEVKLKGFNATLEPPKLKSIKERLRSRITSRTELDDEVRLLKAEADKKFPDNEFEREKMHRLIDDDAREFL